METKQFITHNGDWDTLLVRIAHHLWRWRKYSLKHQDHKSVKVYDLACESVWVAKEAYREPLRDIRKKNAKMTSERMKRRTP